LEWTGVSPVRIAIDGRGGAIYLDDATPGWLTEERMPEVFPSMAQAEKTKIPPTPLVKGGDYKEFLYKSPFGKRGIQGDLKISQWNEFMANARNDHPNP
jgi:hypothetical protein